MSLNGLNILFAGSGAFGVPSLQRLLERGANVVRVYTQPSKPAGRGNKLTPTPVGMFAQARGLSLTETPDINAEALLPADLLVVIAFGQKLAPHVIDHPRLGAVNLHASRLPKYRGAAPINWAIISGETVAGNSVIRLAQTMDAGAVLEMSELRIGELETAGELHDRLALDGAALIERVSTHLRDGTATPLEQDHALATKAPKLSREKSSLDFTREAASLACQIRGMHPWPGCRARLLGVDGQPIDTLTLIRARASESVMAPPGELDPTMHIACGIGSLELVEIQPDGKKPMPFDAYRNGRRLTPGMRLESVTK